MSIQFASEHKYAKFGKGSVLLEATGAKPLDLDTIRTNCPAVLAQEAYSTVSPKYCYISTLDILQKLESEGFYPHLVMQSGCKNEVKRGYTKHLVRFRSEDSVGRGGQVYEVCLLGSHDGTTAWKMFGGFFRWSCGNGTLFFDGKAVCINITHTGNAVPRVIEGAHAVLAQKDLAYDCIEAMLTTKLSLDEKVELALRASKVRWPDQPPPVAPALLLTARRPDDVHNDLWTTFNTIQEHILRGGINYSTTRTVRGQVQQVSAYTRPIRSVDGNVQLNRDLWALAADMLKAKSS